MDRKERLQFCKDRAIEIINRTGNIKEGWASFVSDLGKEESTIDVLEMASTLGMKLMLTKSLDTPDKMINHINGYN